MRILLAHNQYEITGGADVFFRDVGRILELNGHEVAYFSADQEGEKPAEWARYFPDAPNYSSGSLIRRIAAFPKMVYSPDAKTRFSKLLHDWRPDLVHAFAIYTKLTPSILDAASDYGVPVVMTCNDYKLICPNYTLYHHGHICEDCRGGNYAHAVINRCSHDSTVFSTAVAIESAIHRLTGVYSRNVHTYLFESEFIARKYAEFLGQHSFRYRLMRKPFNSRACTYFEHFDNYCLFVGRLHSSKGVDVLLEAMRHCPDYRLKIIGDGPERIPLTRLADELGLANIEFIGWKSGSELSDYIAGARFGIIPSQWFENFPYIITEMFARGKPCIGSRIGGIPELIRDGLFGLLHSANNPIELANCIRKLWENPSQTVQMGLAAKQWADDTFNDDAVYQILIDIYRDVMKENSMTGQERIP